MSFIIEMKNITKRFSNVTANENINFSVKRQEIHSLLGENGAGKSTLMNVLFGLYKADEGRIYINGQPANITSPRAAYNLGLGMVHQHFMLVNRLSVLENVILGQEHGKFKLDLKRSYEIVSGLSAKYGFNLNLDAKVEDLSVGMKQRVEILKALYRGADIIILDEPTAVLTPQEVDELMNILLDMKQQGKTIIFITHKLNETMKIADRITVLRNGKTISTVNKEDVTPEELARLMVGRDVNFQLEKAKRVNGKTVLSLKDIKLLTKNEKTIDLEVHAGEILGIAGVEGNGQKELEEIIVGISRIKGGSIHLNGKNISSLSTKKRKTMGLGYIPSDRHKRAMLSNFSLAENYLLGYHFHLPFSKYGIIQKRVLNGHSEKMISEFGVKASGSEQKIGNLSGGNQQKVIVSREVSQDPCVIVAAQPIRGLDIGAIEYIHRTLLKLRDEGKAILLISAELTEILGLSDRIAVLYEGEIMALKEAEEYTYEEIGLLMAGRREGNSCGENEKL